jgi:hypothetical protein
VLGKVNLIKMQIKDTVVWTCAMQVQQYDSFDRTENEDVTKMTTGETK